MTRIDLLGELLVLRQLTPINAATDNGFTIGVLADLANSVSPTDWYSFLYRASSDYPEHPRWGDLAELADQAPRTTFVVCGSLARRAPGKALQLLAALETAADHGSEDVEKFARLAAVACLLEIAPNGARVLGFDESVGEVALHLDGRVSISPDSHPLQELALWALNLGESGQPLSPRIALYVRHAFVDYLKDQDSNGVLTLVDSGLKMLEAAPYSSIEASKAIAWLVQTMSVGAYQFKVDRLSASSVYKRLEQLAALLPVPILDPDLAVLLAESHAAVVLLASQHPVDTNLIVVNRDSVVALHSQFPGPTAETLCRVAVNGARGGPRADEKWIRSALKVIEASVQVALASGTEALRTLAAGSIRELLYHNGKSGHTGPHLATCWSLSKLLGDAARSDDISRSAMDVYGLQIASALNEASGAQIAVHLAEISTWCPQWDQATARGFETSIRDIANNTALPEDALLTIVGSLAGAIRGVYEHQPDAVGGVASELFGWTQRQSGTTVGAALLTELLPLRDEFPRLIFA